MDERKKKRVKKCPVCNSTKTIIGPLGFVCNKCGYLNNKIIK